jgi:SAM-dependent methyltransferase
VLKSEYVEGKDVLESGGLDVNGTIRPTIEAMHPKSYLSTDIEGGPGVDLICAAEFLRPLSADLVVSVETLEHTSNWKTALLGMVQATRPGGYLLITAPGPGFPYHYAPDNWRFTPEDMGEALLACGLEVLDIRKERPHDDPRTFSLSKKIGDVDISRLAAVEVSRSYRSVGNKAERVRLDTWTPKRGLRTTKLTRGGDNNG